MNNWCVKCETSTTQKHCTRCGKKTIPAYIRCPKCDAEVFVLSKFCGECGRPVQEEVNEHVNKWRGGEKSAAKVGDGVGEGDQGSG